MNAKGPGWWRSSPKIGEKAAAALSQWISNHQNNLQDKPLIDYIIPPKRGELSSNFKDLKIIPLGLSNSRPVPFEVIQLPSPTLSGAFGSNRAAVDLCRISAGNDYDAITQWLSLYPSDGHTYRSNRKEAERFLLWCVLERGKALSDISDDEVVFYRDFLENPLPSSRWCGPRMARWSPNWKPFEGPLSYESQKLAITILKNMCGWLVKRLYLRANPFDALPVMKPRGPIMQINKALTKDEWVQFHEWILDKSNHPEEKTLRTAFAAIMLMRDSGLRKSEVMSVQKSGLENTVLGGVKGWELTLMGKGSRVRTVPISDRTIEVLQRHWKDRNLDFDQIMSESHLLAPVERFPGQQSSAHYSISGVNKLIQTTFERYVREVAPSSNRDLSKIRSHALRHTFGVRAVENGVDLDVVQGILGHKSLNTTTIYVQSDRARRKKQAKKAYD